MNKEHLVTKLASKAIKLANTLQNAADCMSWKNTNMYLCDAGKQLRKIQRLMEQLDD